MPTIPASELVQVNPGVLAAGGTAFEVIGLLLSTSAQTPVGQVLSFPDQTSVADYYGGGSTEAALALNYFAGFVGRDKIPASLKIAQYNTAAVAAYLRGGDISSVPLATLQGLTGTLSAVVDGYARNGGTVNLSSATSYSSAASIIQTALNSAPITIGSFTGVIAATQLTVSGATGSPLAVGQTVVGAGIAAGTRITALGTGTGGNGTYTINNSQTVGSEAMTTQPTPVAVSYDSISGGLVVTSGITGAPSSAAYATGQLADDLKLDLVDGAVLSQGAVAATPAAFMTALVAQDATWTNFMTAFDPDGSGNTVKQAFGAWTASLAPRFGYVCWDLDQSPCAAVPANASLGQIFLASGNSGTMLLGGDTSSGWSATTAAQTAAFVMGAAASIDFDATDGRTTFAYRAQSGLPAGVTSATIAQNLAGNPQTSGKGNGYNFYGAYGAGGAGFVDSVWLQRGFVTGPFNWFDSYIDQVWMTATMQAALLSLMGNAKSIPFSDVGASKIEAALATAIQQGLAFGAYAPGAIDASQAAQVNASAGANISDTLQTQGYYLQVPQASSIVRASRGPQQVKFWYLDRGSVQSINLQTTAVQ